MPTPVPLSASPHFEMKPSPLTIAHQGQFPVVTVSFNVAEGSSLAQAVDAVNRTQANLHMPASVIIGFSGDRRCLHGYRRNEALLILAALLAVYIVLGVLYESFIHPLTILSRCFPGWRIAPPALFASHSTSSRHWHHPAHRYREEEWWSG